MVVTSDTRTQELWGRFESVKDHLFKQYQEAKFDPSTGVSLDELEAQVAAYLAAHPDQPRILQKANVFRIVLAQARIAIDPEDWFVDKINDFRIGQVPVHDGAGREGRFGRDGLTRRLSDRWLDEAVKGTIEPTASWLDRAFRVGQASGPKGGLDRGHIAPGWDTLMSAGLTGLLARVAEARDRLGAQATADQLAFYSAVEITCQAAIDLADRFAQLALRMAQAHPEHQERLLMIHSALSNVPAHRPRTFHEALQFHWLMHELYEMEGEYVRSAGQFDRTFYPFYRADIDSGRLTREQAKELLKFFWYKWYSRTEGRDNGKNFCFGGQYADGTVIDNELTYLGLEAHGELNTPDPKLSIRFLPSSPDRLTQRVAEMVRKNGSLVIMNDVPAVEALVKRGIAVEDARMHLPIGCYEPVVEGKGVGCTMNLTVNLAKGVELALNDGRDPATGEQVGPHSGDPRHFTSFEDLWGAYVQQMDYFLEHALDCIGAAERAWPQISPAPLIAATIDDCIARGQDVSQGGAIYNSVGFVGAGLANAGDSLLALKKVVFDEKRFTMDEVLEALRTNYEGQERMRQYLITRVPKWGNGNPEADALATRVADYYCNKVHSFTNARGGPCMAALFTLTFALIGGQRTGALPDGRRAGDSLAPGVGASYGRDRNGVTALINSVVKLDSTLVPNGAVLDVTLHPSALKEEDGLQSLVALIRGFLNEGGYAVQFNVFDVETLRDAQRYPERYSTLQVRVTGWSVYYTCLSRAEQDQYIARVTHGL